MIFFSNNILSKVFTINKISSVKKSNIKKKLNTKNCKNLHDSLKQLEFISFFEMYLDKKNEDSYSLSFIQELENIRYYAEVNTLKSIEYCKG
ncbi:hypothetical protein CW733_10690 [Lacinutrix sp. Bg11-31]|nr:hypothetical protein CW733_10690 [Lacinutrix sp. Bg11-31]